MIGYCLMVVEEISRAWCFVVGCMNGEGDLWWRMSEMWCMLDWIGFECG
jgi:hypothetical protein